MHTWELSKLPNIPLATFRNVIQPMLTAALRPSESNQIICPLKLDPDYKVFVYNIRKYFFNVFLLKASLLAIRQIGFPGRA